LFFLFFWDQPFLSPSCHRFIFFFVLFLPSRLAYFVSFKFLHRLVVATFLLPPSLPLLVCLFTVGNASFVFLFLPPWLILFVFSFFCHLGAGRRLIVFLVFLGLTISKSGCCKFLLFFSFLSCFVSAKQVSIFFPFSFCKLIVVTLLLPHHCQCLSVLTVRMPGAGLFTHVSYFFFSSFYLPG